MCGTSIAERVADAAVRRCQLSREFVWASGSDAVVALEHAQLVGRRPEEAERLTAEAGSREVWAFGADDLDVERLTVAADVNDRPRSPSVE
jgi:hypothetical protein